MNITKTSRTNVRRTVALTLALIGSAGLAATASAGTPAVTDANTPSAVVRYGDLNLSTEQGVQKLYARIARVAKQVCPDGESRGLENLARARACQQEAIERAVGAVHNERLAAVSAAARHQG